MISFSDMKQVGFNNKSRVMLCTADTTKHTNLKVISGRGCTYKYKDAEHNVLQTLNQENKVNKEIYSRGQGNEDVTYFVELMEANSYAHHNDGEGTVVPPSVARWTCRGR